MESLEAERLQLDEQLTELTSQMETLKEEHSSQLEVVTEEKAGLEAELAESKAAAEMAEATAEVAPTVSTHRTNNVEFRRWAPPEEDEASQVSPEDCNRRATPNPE